MKKIITLVCLIALGVSLCQAQTRKGEMAVGAKMVYGSWVKSLGLGGRFQYGLLDQVRLEGDFDIFFKHDGKSCADLDLNAHYLLGLWRNQLYLYPIVGLNYTIASRTVNGVKDDENHLGLNLGAGIEYEITPHWAGVFEYRHTVVKRVNQGIIALGVNYKF